MNRTIFLTACIFGLLAIILGAFGAHGLEKLVDEDAIATFETGVTYQMYHAFFLFVLALLPQLELSVKKLIYSLIVTGVILFSLSIYFLALNSLMNFDFGKIGFLTPIGGVFLIAGWGTLGYQLYRKVQ
jgi:uncharacterized membrane protein YgdD (TMEM256/DUF423 family)